MTLLAFAERLRQCIEADEVQEDRHHERVVYRALVGKQMFIVICEEGEPDRDEPAMT